MLVNGGVATQVAVGAMPALPAMQAVPGVTSIPYGVEYAYSYPQLYEYSNPRIVAPQQPQIPGGFSTPAPQHVAPP